jgi:translocation and assembly module TamB
VTADVKFPQARLTAQATGRLDRSAPAHVNVAFVDLDLDPVLARSPAIPSPIAPVRGAVSGTAVLDVPLDAPARSSGTVTLGAVRLVAAGETWRNTGPVVIHREPDATRAERLQLESAAGTVAAAGRVTDAGALAATVDARIGLAPLPRFRPEVREARGVAEASVELRGSLTAPEARGRATLRDASVVLRDVPHPVTDVRAELALVPGRVRVTSARASVLGSTVAVSGDVVLERPSPRLDLQVDGDVPLGVVAAFRPEVRDARGTLQVKARVGGTVARPEPTGQGTLRAEFVTLRDYPEPIRDVRARLTASPARLAVSDAVATVGGGTVRASGGLALQPLGSGPYAFTIEARRVGYEPARDFTTTWDADLELVGAGARAQVRGEARLVRGEWISETPLLRLLLERGAGSAPSPEEGVGLSVRLVIPETLLVRTAVARLRARGALELAGTTTVPVVFGTVEVVDGQILFRKQRFTVTRAAARFVDPRRIDPVVDVQATAKIGRYDVRLGVTGRTENLEVRLASSPPLPEEDILSLIAFGATRADLGKGGAGPVVGEVAGLILQDLFGIGSGPGLGPLDVFELKNTETSGRALELGKRLGERATVTYSQGIERTAERRLRLEYEVLGPLVVAGEQDFRGGFGGDVLIRLRFR